ncbi:unnamed protein product [Spodoptera littoralis]|uniref:Uncharacterized protein n=1 Tax=Spodoptera littoralis TaxID=7109 RepID=A0A9P0I671_SPOLI|nr:unnamed protein product [Spodoptera littoralis]CAH1639603.1 unnamed protein product [Spodoptera littoralis]
MKSATDYLEIESGEKFSFCFDSGAQCFLVKESLAERFPGKRLHALVTLLGIGSFNVNCNVQILTDVTIQGYSMQVLFHVVPDECIPETIMVGRVGKVFCLLWIPLHKGCSDVLCLMWILVSSNEY